MMKIHKTKFGQPYVITKSGRAKFIKRGSVRSSERKSLNTRFRHSDSMVRRHRGSRRSYRRARSGLGGMFSSDLLYLGIGAGLAGVAGSQVNKYLPQLSGNIAEGAAGAGVMFASKYMGGNMVRTIGKGMLIKAIGDLIEDNVVPKIMGSVTATSTTSTGW